MNKLIRLWTGPLPQEELFPTDRTVNQLLHWIAHPIKRHLARTYLKLLQKFFGLKVIAVAGSNAKTTTRTMLQTVLPNSVATKDSVTSTYNIPSSIFRLTPLTKYFICEMSVEYIGDMDFYRWLATPDLIIMTMIETEHTKYFGSIENVAREENKLIEKAKRGIPIIINGNSPLISTNTRGKVYKFGTSPHFDAYIKSSQLTKNFTTIIELEIKGEKSTIELPAIGTHLAHPVASVMVTAHILGIKNPQLSAFIAAPHRLSVVMANSGAIILDDSYNSNPSSAKAALSTAVELAKLTKRELVLVFSQMNELGQYEIPEHQKLGDAIKKSGAKYVFSIGPAASKIGQHVESIEELTKTLKKMSLNSKHLILIKSSRSWKLEKLVNALTS